MWGYFFALLLLAYGPAISLFYLVISKKAQLVIVSIAAAFFWFLSSLTFALIWFILPIKSTLGLFIPFAVAIEELFRYLFFRAYARAENQFSLTASNGVVFPMTDLTSSFSSGYGWGVISTLLLYSSVIATSIGPGTLYSDSCPNISTFTLAALYTMFFIFHNCAWMLIAFDGYRRGCRLRISGVFISHLIASLFV